MSSHFFSRIVALSLVTLSPAALVASKNPREEAAFAKAAVEELVAGQVRATLPAGLALGQVHIGGVAIWKPGATLAVTWPAPPRAGSVSVIVSARLDDRELWKTFARVDLKALRKVVIARRDLHKGEVLGTSDLDYAERAIDTTRAPHSDTWALVGEPTLRDIAAGHVVYADDVTLPPPSASGTAVKVIVRRHNVVIATAGVLERPLRPGETGQARLIAGMRLVTGRLVDHGTLLVGDTTELVAGPRPAASAKVPLRAIADASPDKDAN